MSKGLACLLAVLQILAHSAAFTDNVQSRHWIAGTPDNPIRAPNGYYAYETHPLLAGSPEALDGYFQQMGFVIAEAPNIVEPRIAALGLALLALTEWRAVIANNAKSAAVGFPQYWGIAYTWHF